MLVRMWALLYTVAGIQNGAVAMENNTGIPQKMKNRTII